MAETLFQNIIEFIPKVRGAGFNQLNSGISKSYKGYRFPGLCCFLICNLKNCLTSAPHLVIIPHITPTILLIFIQIY